MLELCTPIIYGSPKVAAYHRKAMDIQTNFSIVNSADDAQPDKTEHRELYGRRIEGGALQTDTGSW